MVPFKLPAWREKQIRAKFRAKDACIHYAVTNMERVMEQAVNQILSHWVATQHYFEPSLQEMFAVSEAFYRKVVTSSFESAEEEKKLQVGRKRLAKVRGPTGIPRKLKDLNQIFRNSREWQKIMKRSGVLTERMRKKYISDLARTFDRLVPALREGKISPQDAKDHMMDRWRANKSKVDTIFRTETTNYFGRTQVAFFESDPEIIGFMFDSIRDKSRTDICRSRHGLIYRPGTKLLRENCPACHYRCRSHLIALANTAYNRKLLEDPKRDPSKVSVIPLPQGWRKSA